MFPERWEKSKQRLSSSPAGLRDHTVSDQEDQDARYLDKAESSSAAEESGPSLFTSYVFLDKMEWTLEWISILCSINGATNMKNSLSQTKSNTNVTIWCCTWIFIGLYYSADH